MSYYIPVNVFSVLYGYLSVMNQPAVGFEHVTSITSPARYQLSYCDLKDICDLFTSDNSEINSECLPPLSFNHLRIWINMINTLKTYAAISNAHLSRVCKRGELSGCCLSTLNGFGSTQLPIFLCHIGVPTFSSQNN